MTARIARLNGTLQGRYRSERELGAGGMATVYLAGDLRHERKVALKVLKPELAAIVGADRFLAEIKTTANLHHPHILPLHDSGEADGFLFYVMPYVEGESLQERLDREKQLPIEEAVRIATNVAEAPSAAGARCAVPANVDAVARKALEKLPADRFSDAQHFITALGDPGCPCCGRGARRWSLHCRAEPQPGV